MVIARSDSTGARSLRGASAAAEGLLGALRRRRVNFQGLSAGILGAGPVARSAAAVLKAEKTEIILYSANPEADRSSAESLGVKVTSLKSYPEGHHWVLLNALPWTRGASPPPPVPLERIHAELLAVDLVQDSALSAFLEAVESRGACTMPWRERLAAELTAQLRIATGLHVAEGEAQRLLEA
jgi:shikimate 5-dehydrogenase